MNLRWRCYYVQLEQIGTTDYKNNGATADVAAAAAANFVLIDDGDNDDDDDDDEDNAAAAAVDDDDDDDADDDDDDDDGYDDNYHTKTSKGVIYNPVHLLIKAYGILIWYTELSSNDLHNFYRYIRRHTTDILAVHTRTIWQCIFN